MQIVVQFTWHDLTDDLWGPRISFFPGAPYDPEKVEALDMDASGTIWAGGNGLVGFRFDERFNEVTTVADFGAKTPDTDGLISSNVTDVAVDRNGYVWVVTAGGLNRVRPVGNGHDLDAWFDVVTYSANTDLGILYSPSRISSMTRSAVFFPTPLTCFRAFTSFSTNACASRRAEYVESMANATLGPTPDAPRSLEKSSRSNNSRKP